MEAECTKVDEETDDIKTSTEGKVCSQNVLLISSSTIFHGFILLCPVPKTYSTCRQNEYLTSRSCLIINLCFSQRQLNIPLEVDSSGLSDSEKEIRASHEKNKGNEAFKAGPLSSTCTFFLALLCFITFLTSLIIKPSGDTEEAVIYYSHSISLIPTPACYNNRALAYLKLEKWKV